MKFQTATLSRNGGRKDNEDYIIYKEEEGYACWVVADGLGGHPGGALASRIVAEEIAKRFFLTKRIDVASIRLYMKTAHGVLLQQQEEEGSVQSYKTTVVALFTDGKNMRWGHAGDSRIYRIHRGSVVYQSRDHSVPQLMVDAGELKPGEIRFHEDRNRLLRVFGMRGDLQPEVDKELTPALKGDAYLLCTDGFWEYVTETEMEIDFAKAASPEEWLAYMEERLLQRAQARDRRGFDNYSAIGIFC